MHPRRARPWLVRLHRRRPTGIQRAATDPGRVGRTPRRRRVVTRLIPYRRGRLRSLRRRSLLRASRRSPSFLVTVTKNRTRSGRQADPFLLEPQIKRRHVRSGLVTRRPEDATTGMVEDGQFDSSGDRSETTESLHRWELNTRRPQVVPHQKLTFRAATLTFPAFPSTFSVGVELQVAQPWVRVVGAVEEAHVATQVDLVPAHAIMDVAICSSSPVQLEHERGC